MKKLFILIMLLVNLPSIAQELMGKVKDENGEGIPEVSIRNANQNRFAKTDFLGNFSLKNMEEGDSLSFKMIGYSISTYVYNKEREIEISLSPRSISLDAVEVKPNMDAMQIFADVNIGVNPVNSSQDLLRMVPGLFTGQHAGGGKAEQIFLRGFDIDHGTDLNISVDGMPVNMVSHAHGQGYSDLHFVIPETIEGIEFSKGSYKADQGNFATAGSVGFKTKDRINQSSASVEYGSFNHKRALGMFNLIADKTSNNQAYLASEYIYSDGPFISPQNFKRFNIMGKWNSFISNTEKLTFSASHFTSKWNASGQIPTRAVESGLIGRFGAIDNTEGGNTSRTNAAFIYDKSLLNNAFLQSRAYYTNYDFLLFSNFTFFAINPINGDQIKQSENRNLYGFETSYGKAFDKVELNASVGIRSDFVRNNELSRTKNKTEVLENVYLGNIDETNSYLNLNAGLELGKINIVPGLRVDHFYFNYNDKLINDGISRNHQSVLVSPKLSFIVQPNSVTQFFFKAGTGYHSNDTRAVVYRQNNQVLPRSYGADLGTVLKPNNKLLLNATLWFLNLQQEFVYVGDEGIVEPSGKTRRLGADFGIRAQLNDKLFFDSDITYSHARSLEEVDGQNYIPLAPAFTYSGGLSFVNNKGFSGGIKTRILGKRPANEYYSLVAKGYWVTDANINYQKGAWKVGFNIQNLFNATWNETQFATESRLLGEQNAVNEINFTPGAPFSLKTVLTFRF
jgi:hypothetical protein